MSKLLTFLAILLLVSGMVLGIKSHQDTRTQLQIKTIEVKAKQVELKRIENEYDRLLKELDKSKGNEKRIQQLNEKMKQLQKEKEEALQAKAERERARIAAQEASESVFSEPVYAEPSSGGDIAQIVREAAVKHGLDPEWFLQKAQCESGLNPNAVNTGYYENGHPSGLFQHLSGYWPARAEAHGYGGASVFDPVANANVSAAMIASGANNLWEC